MYREATMEFNNVLLEKEGNIAIVTINRPKALNALNSETLKELNAVIEDLENDKEIYCVILTGSGEKSFVAGADISEMKDLDSKGGKEFGLLGNKVFRRLENLDKPVIAAISGFALGGGCELAMACDIRIASEKAKFIQAFVGVGLAPDAGGLYLLTRSIGINRATQITMTGEPVSAEKALDWGIAYKVVDSEKLEKTVSQLIKKLNRSSVNSFKAIKEMVWESEFAGWEKYAKLELDLQKSLAFTEDFKEGVRAYSERRRPKFQGK